MNEDQLRKLAEKVNSITLPPEIKGRQLSHIQSFMESHPVSVTNAAEVSHRGGSGTIQAQSRYLFTLNSRNSMPIGLILAVLLAGGTSAAAQSSLPGDALYPVKISVNEKVQSFLAVGHEAQAAVEAHFASERLAEAEKLAADNRLDATVEAKLATEFEAHAERARSEAAELSHEGKAEAAVAVTTDLEGALGVHKSALVNLSARGEGATKTRLLNIANVVEARLSSTTEDRVVAETAVRAKNNVAGDNSAGGAVRALRATSSLESHSDSDKKDDHSGSKSEGEVKINLGF